MFIFRCLRLDFKNISNTINKQLMKEFPPLNKKLTENEISDVLFVYLQPKKINEMNG